MEHSGPTHLPLRDGEERGPLGGRGTKAKTVAAFLAPVDAFFFFFFPVPNLSFGGPWQMSKARAGIPG